MDPPLPKDTRERRRAVLQIFEGLLFDLAESQKLVEMCWNTMEMCWNMLKYVEICWNMLKYHGNTRIESHLKWIEMVMYIDLPQFHFR